MSLDLFAGIGPAGAGFPAPAPVQPAGNAPVFTLPLTDPPTPPPHPALHVPPPPTPQHAAPPGRSWWSVEHHATDGVRHTYCGSCYTRIPEFLIRESAQLPEPETAAARCEGCGDGPDLTAETVEVLGAILTAVRAAEPYPAGELDAVATAACLEHASRCVLLCAAARGPDA